MRLTDLNPRFYVLVDGGPRVGLTFECPHCRETRLGVLFHHRGHEAMEDEVIHAEAPANHDPIWTWDGTDFTDLSLSPSVDASGRGHWHGFVSNGEVTNANG